MSNKSTNLKSPKKGIEYQRLVAELIQAMYPTAKVDPEVWEKGPDGKFNYDVRMIFERNGVQEITHVECKEYKETEPVGRDVISQFDSEMRDVKSNHGIVVSSSGFTEDAIRKAARLGIDTVSAIKAGDKKYSVTRYHELKTSKLSVNNWRLDIFDIPGYEEIGSKFKDPYSLQYQGQQVVNWLSQESRAFLLKYPGDHKVEILYSFDQSHEFTIAGKPIKLKSILLYLETSKECVTQTVGDELNPSGFFDHQRNNVVAPTQWISYVLGMIKNDAWKKIEFEEKQNLPPERTLDIGQVQIDVEIKALTNQIKPGEKNGTPDLTKIVKNVRINFLV